MKETNKEWKKERKQKRKKERKKEGKKERRKEKKTRKKGTKKNKGEKKKVGGFPLIDTEWIWWSNHCSFVITSMISRFVSCVWSLPFLSINLYPKNFIFPKYCCLQTWQYCVKECKKWNIAVCDLRLIRVTTWTRSEYQPLVFILSCDSHEDFLLFVACTRLYKPLCRSVRRSVGPSGGRSVGRSVRPTLLFFSQSGL